jgi:hypothetical protein
MSIRPLSPGISAGFTVAPEVVYSPIVSLAPFTTNRLPADTAMPSGKISPETSAGVREKCFVEKNHSRSISSRFSGEQTRVEPSSIDTTTASAEVTCVCTLPVLPTNAA